MILVSVGREGGMEEKVAVDFLERSEPESGSGSGSCGVCVCLCVGVRRGVQR